MQMGMVAIAAASPGPNLAAWSASGSSLYQSYRIESSRILGLFTLILSLLVPTIS